MITIRAEQVRLAPIHHENHLESICQIWKHNKVNAVQDKDGARLFKLTDTLIETWVTLLNRVAIYTDSPSYLLVNEIQKKTKQIWVSQSEAVSKVRYNIYIENKTLRLLFCPGENERKNKNK